MQRSARVLVIDDEIVVLALIQAHLESEGYVVETAEDGVAGLEQARRLLPDAIICDIVMPRLDGFRLLAELRKDERTAAIPVALLTGLSGEIGRTRAAGAGADAVLIKPVARAELLAAVRSLVAGRSAAPAVIAQAPRSANATAAAVSGRVEQRHVALLLCEIRNYADVAATLSAGELAEMLNGHRARVCEAVVQHDGWIARSNDEPLAAVFESPPQVRPDYAGRAAEAAMRIVRDARSVDARGNLSLVPGIALHLGEAVLNGVASVGAGNENGQVTVGGGAMVVAQELLRCGRQAHWAIAASTALVRAAGAAIDADRGAAARFAVDGQTMEMLEITGSAKVSLRR